MKYYLNLRSGYAAPVTLHCSYGDSGEEVTFYVYDGNESVNLNGTTVTLHGTRKDGASFGPFFCIPLDDSIKFTLQPSMTAVEGSAIAEFVIVKDGVTIGTSNFGILVEKAVFPDGVSYDSDPSVYQDILSYVQNISADISKEYLYKIAVEQQERASADKEEQSARVESNKQMQNDIDRLTAQVASFERLPSGSTSGDAELIDARIGVDGTTYTNVGTAIRTQVNNLKEDIDYFGSILAFDYSKDTQSTATPHQISRQVSLAAGDYVVELSDVSGDTSVNLFFSADTSVANSSVVFSEYGIPIENKIYMFSISSVEANKINYLLARTGNNVLSAYATIRLYDRKQFELRYAKKVTETIHDNIGAVPLIFEYGSIDPGNLNSSTQQDRRIRTPWGLSFTLNVGDKILINKSDIRFILFGESYSSGWRSTDYTVDTAGNYRILVAHSDETNPISSIRELSDGITIIRKNSFAYYLNEKADSSDTSSIPNYYYENDWLPNKIKSINDTATALNGVAFPFITDLHFSANALKSKYLLKEVLNSTGCSMVIAGGDYAPAYGSESILQSTYDTLLDYAGYIGHDKWFSVIGNHDFRITASSSDNTKTYIPWGKSYNALIRPAERWIVHAESSGGYYCIDNEVQKTRFIMLNSTEFTLTTKEGVNDGTIPRYRTEQISWFVERLTELSNYNIIVVTHVPTDTSISSSAGNVVQAILEAFANKTTYSGDISADFTGTTNTLICHLSGHCHTDESHMSNGVLGITTTCDACYQDDGHGAVAGTITEQAFDVFCIDYDARTINAVRVGRGDNRSWTY